MEDGNDDITHEQKWWRVTDSQDIEGIPLDIKLLKEFRQIILPWNKEINTRSVYL